MVLLEPLDYLDFIHVMNRAFLIITDSGGVQEEAPALGKPVLVLREKTERPEAVAAGTAALLGLSEDTIYRKTRTLLDNPRAYRTMANAINPYGDGQAAERTVRAIRWYFGMTKSAGREFVPGKNRRP